MDNNTAPLNNRVLYLTSTMKDHNLSDDYKIVLQIPDLSSYKFGKISLISCMFPNLFLTFQGNNTNNILKITYKLALYENDYIKVKKRITKTINYEFREGYYGSDGDNILNVINNTLMMTTIGDLMNDPNKKRLLYVKPPIHFNRENPYSRTLQYDAYFDLDPMWYMYEIEITLPGLIYRMLGGKKENEQIILTKELNMKTPNHFIYSFPNVPNAIWVNSVQVRFNVVDATEDSNILANIPITDETQDYVSYINPQVNEIYKTVKSNISSLIEIQLTNQDGYEIKLKDLNFNFDIKLF